MSSRPKPLLFVLVMVVTIMPLAASATSAVNSEAPTRLVAGLVGASGSTVGPGGDLYVTEGAAGRISRVDTRTGDITTFAIADGLDQPTSLEIIRNTAYVTTLGGEIWRIEDVSGPPYGVRSNE